jgi:hypothetical protein
MDKPGVQITVKSEVYEPEFPPAEMTGHLPTAEQRIAAAAYLQRLKLIRSTSNNL